MTSLPEGANPGGAKTVLLIEDDHEIRVRLRELLEDEGYRVLTAANGRSALDVLEGGAAAPDVIVLDLMLPVMDGWRFAASVRADPRFAQVPIVVQSAFTSPPPPRDVAAFLLKPVDEGALLNEIRRSVARG